jgi:adenylyl-sulfate kinase
MKTVTKVFWLFGRSGAGKTTLARRLRRGMEDLAIPVVYLDADELRATVCSDLGFSPQARLENHRRIAEIARHLAGQDLNVVVSTMAPEYAQRDLVAQILGEKLFWFYIHAPLDVCMSRDPKGLYKRAAAGQVKNLISYPFDAPRPEESRILIDTGMQDIETCCHELVEAAREQLVDFVI